MDGITSRLLFLHWDGASAERTFKAKLINSYFDPLEIGCEATLSLKRSVWTYLFPNDDLAEARSQVRFSECRYWDCAQLERDLKAKLVSRFFAGMDDDLNQAMFLKRKVWSFLFCNLRSRLLWKEDIRGTSCYGVQLFGTVPIPTVEEAEDVESGTWKMRLPFAPPEDHIFFPFPGMYGPVFEPLPSLVLDDSGTTRSGGGLCFAAGVDIHSSADVVYLGGFGVAPKAITFEGTYIGYSLL